MTADSEHLFGNIAIKHAFLNVKEVNECLDIQGKMDSYGLQRKHIGEIAIERGFITRHQLQLILNIQQAIIKEKRNKTPAPAANARRAPAVREQHHRPSSALRISPLQAPVARSGIQKYAEQMLLRRIVSLLGLGITVIIILFLALNLRNKRAEHAYNEGRGRDRCLSDQETNAVIAREQVQIRSERERRAEELYQEVKEWASKNRDRVNEITRRCNRIAVEYAQTAAAQKASILADIYAELSGAPESAGAGDPAAAQASQLYMKLSMEALKFRATKQYAKAIEVYRRFPEKFKNTKLYNKVQAEITKLRRQMAHHYEADLQVINRLVAQRKFDEARKHLAQIEKYASAELVSEIRRKLDSYIKETGREPAPVPKAEFEKAFFVEKLRVAESMFWRNMYEEALEAYQDLATEDRFAFEHPEIPSRIRDLQRILSALNAVAKSYVKTVGRKRHIYLEEGSPIYARIVSVHDRVITAAENGDNIQVLLSDLATSSVMKLAKKYLPPRTTETELALGTFLLSRKQFKEARKHFEKAAEKDDAPHGEIKRLIARLDQKPPSELLDGEPASQEETAEDAAKPENMLKTADALFKDGKYAQAHSLYRRLLAEHPDSPAVSENKDRITKNLAVCRRNLSSDLSSIFNGTVLERNDLGKSVIEVSYDFEDEKQLKDWKEYNWYSIFDMYDSKWHIVEGELSGNGSRGFLWKGVIAGDVKVEFDAYSTAADRQNIQATICDNGEGFNYLFAVGLTELGAPMDLIRRNERFATGEEIATRRSEAKSFKKYHIKIIRQGPKMLCYVDNKLILKAQHARYTKGHVGLFAIGSTVRFDNLTIIGHLDRAWLKEQKAKKAKQK